MYINVSVPVFDSDVCFLLLSSFCIYVHVKLSRKPNTTVSSLRHLDRNASRLQIDGREAVNEKGKFGNVLQLLKRQQKRISFKGKYVYKAPGKDVYLQRELQWYRSCWGVESDTRIRNYVSKCHGLAPLENGLHPKIIILDNTLYTFYENGEPLFNSLASADVKLGTRSFEHDASTVGDVKYWSKMLEYGTSWCSTTNDKIFPSKVDFMRWRDESTTTKAHGFRFTYMQHPTSSKDKMKGHYMYDPVQIQQSDAYFLMCLRSFLQVSSSVSSENDILYQLLEQLKTLENVLKNLALFSCHNVIGSSLHIGYDYFAKKKLFVKWIDFSHTKKLVGENTKDDGVLIGIASLIKFLRQLQ